MKFALSTNWFADGELSGEAIADRALELGFDALELGFRTTPEQVAGFKSRLGAIPVGSVHAFCPVPISAPQGHPELYQLASAEENERKLARIYVTRNIEFAAEMGADAVVLHAGKVDCRGLLVSRALARRFRRGAKAVEVLRRELDVLVPILEKHSVRLALENLPYLEGFPAEWELAEFCGEWVRSWLDLGHHYVRSVRGWVAADGWDRLPPPIGMHIHDSQGGDDHLVPGDGKIDFAIFAALAARTPHLVFEPKRGVDAMALKSGLALLRRLWQPEVVV